MRRTAAQNTVRMITTGVMLALLAGVAIKLKIFGGSPRSRTIRTVRPTAPALEATFSFPENPMTPTFYDHWRKAPEDAWRWPNFSPAEIACRGTGKLLIKPALERLQALRDRLGKPLIVRSAYRRPEHNRAVGGATRSKHMDGTAFDIAMSNHDPLAFEAAAREVGFLGFGFYPRSGFIHVDRGPARQWGERFPVRATAFAAETCFGSASVTASQTCRRPKNEK